MKKIIITAILAGGAILASQSGFAQSTFQFDNLYWGFQNKLGGGPSDYIINLGPASGIVGGSSVVDFSPDFSMSDFNAVLGGSSSIPGGVVGGNTSSTADIYVTQFRNGGAGDPAVPGSSVTATPSRNGIQLAVSTLGQVHFPSTTGAGTNDTYKTWESYVEPADTQNSFLGNSGINPDTSAGTSTILYEDLWSSTNSQLTGYQPYVYLGYFALDLTGDSPKLLTFVPKAAPPQLTKPVILSVSKAADSATVILTSVPNYNYQLQYSTSLSSPSWNPVGSPVLSSTWFMTNVDNSATDPQRFYRVQAH